MVRGELKSAADSMALAAAARLIGTDASLDEASANAQLALSGAGGLANRYDYGGLEIGGTSGRLSSQVEDPVFYETFEAATAEGDGGATDRMAPPRGTRITLVRRRAAVFLELRRWRRAA
jgi:hypothetical protein